jgi:double-strand break repair protein MRE11
LRAQADILLLGGDLFHENKPSRQCMVKAMKLFKHYVLGDRCASARARFLWRRSVLPVAGIGHASLQQSVPSS